MKVTLFLFLILLPYSGSATEPLFFKEMSGSEASTFSSLLKIDEEITHLARTDLNKDGLDDFILFEKKPDCLKKITPCSYFILGQAKEDIALLNQIEAYNIAVSDIYKFGVRDLIVYNNAHNDYAHIVYRWDPASRRYKIKADE